MKLILADLIRAKSAKINNIDIVVTRAFSVFLKLEFVRFIAVMINIGARLKHTVLRCV